MSEYHPYKQGEYQKSSRSIDDPSSGKAPPESKATKRIRGEIACAECRRLKIRCDKLVPCSTCVKRGCQTLCPNGTIPPGQGSRFVLAATDHLHRKLAKFEARMHALDDALAIAQTTYNLPPHPLLSLQEDEDDTDDVQKLRSISEQPEKETNTRSDGPGSLHVNGSGISRFFGPSELTTGSVTLGRTPQVNFIFQFTRAGQFLPAPEIINFTRSFPLTPPNIPIASTQKSIESFLPPIERAISLCDVFLENLSWMFHIVSRQLLVTELIPAIYRGDSRPHDLALLFTVLAIGVLVDMDMEPYSLEAQHFYHLARAATVLQPILTEPSVVTIKVLHLMSIHNGLSGQESNLEQSYALLNLAGQVSTKIGFHIDPSNWKFEAREVYDRRVYFWNLMAGILWTCLVVGRPPNISPEFIDCRIPTAEEEALYQQGEFPIGFGVWGFQVTAKCLLPLVETTLSAKPPSYDSVLELDTRIRQTVVPPKADNDPLDDRTAISMRTFVRSHYQHLLLLYLHRGFFTQAMSEYPSNPLLSPHHKSVVAAYQSACAVLDDTREQFQRKPRLVCRIWRIWTFAFSAAVIVGTVAARGAHLNLEPRALEQFEAACDVFRRAAEISPRAAKALPVLQAMLQKATEANKAQHSEFIDMANEEFRPNPSETDYRARRSSPPLTRGPNNQQQFEPFPPVQLPTKGPSSKEDRSFVSSDIPYNGSRTHHSDRRPMVPLPPLSSDKRTDLSQSWGGLFHEGLYSSDQSHGHKRGSVQNAPYGDSTMLHDRWTSFMNYNVWDERPPPRMPTGQFRH
ncbi:hypothetical protein BDP27DRAFT_1440995 [Rhodocollybia butyracea]|uniref:Zn(2)-C6 fungal-type domain-containing protein n=1 Tax=Rhodocollybia butyracea TaxID=206335 RepID=A0A9P5QAE8_9AGAR|nr:hypothetical protein BDP27DRAFT_1440995 [Rhodocollybia butyracea]